jgi:hypothetical protein
MTPQEAENLIIDLLRASIKDRAVENYPDDPRNYIMKHPFGALLIRYDASQWSSEDVNFLSVNQDRNLIISVWIKNKSLKSNSGAIGDVQRVIECLQGYDISSYNDNRPARISITSDGFRDYESETGIWDYEVKVKLPGEQSQSESLQ